MKRTKHTLITAEILGFFMIIIGILGILTGRRIYTIIAFFMFGLVFVAAAVFALFAVMAVKEHKRPHKNRK